MSEANDKDDDALDTYLSGDSELSRCYRSGGNPQPSASVDRAIIEAAREETAAPSTPRRHVKLRSGRPWAIAAAVMLSAILFVSIQRETGLVVPDEGEAERSLEYREGDARPATPRLEPRAAAPSQRAKESPARAGAAAPAAEQSRRDAAEPESQSLAADDTAIENALAHIRMAWAGGEQERAEELLETFREEYPDVGEERLRQTLPAALLMNGESP
jgi:hypothetical protein